MKVNKYLIVASTIMLLLFVFMLLPSTINSKRTFTFLYSYEATKKNLIVDSIILKNNIKLTLTKAPKPNLFEYQGVYKEGKKILLSIEIIDNYGSPKPNISQKSQLVNIEWYIKTTLFDKCMQLLSGETIVNNLLKQYTNLANNASSIYSVDGKREGLKDSLGYTDVLQLDANISNDALFEIIKTNFKKVQNIAEKYQAFPGNFSIHLNSNNLMYAWMTNVAYKKMDYLHPVNIPSKGFMYATKKMLVSNDSLYYLQSQIVLLAKDRGFTQVAVPFMKIYEIDTISKKLNVQFFTPIL